MTAPAPVSRLRGVLFDKDGTLVDFHQTWMPVYRHAASTVAALARRPGIEARLLEAAGYDANADRCLPRSALSAGTVDEISAIWARESGIDPAAVTGEVGAIFDSQAPQLAVPVRGLHDVLARLRGRDLALGVATMDSKASAQATLARIGIDGHFDFICGFDSGHGRKPEPGMVDAFCREVGLAPGEVVLVGDTLHDLDMGRAAAVGRIVGVLTGSCTREQLEPHCDAVIEGIYELEALLEKWETGKAL
ncbi:MAG: HAD family hydrolase [Gammaproteobacteria bacterium]|nr:HAD family hydrolase [Gammaproteobacteria bacterium]